MIITNSVCWNTSCLSDLHHVNLTWDGFGVGSWVCFLYFYVFLFCGFGVLPVPTMLSWIASVSIYYVIDTKGWKKKSRRELYLSKIFHDPLYRHGISFIYLLKYWISFQSIIDYIRYFTSILLKLKYFLESPIHYLPSDFDTCHHHINFENKMMTWHTNKDDMAWTNCDMDIYI